MSKLKQRQARGEEDAISSQSAPEEKGATPQPAADPVVHRLRGNLPALVIASSLWVGWFAFLVYVALARA